MTPHSDPAHHVPPSAGPATGRAAAGPDGSRTGLFRALARTPLFAMRRRASPRSAPTQRSTTARTSSPTALFRPGEVEYAHLQSLPPFVSDHLILTDLRILRVRTDDSGAITQLSQAASRQISTARSEHFRDRATVTVELHLGSSLRLEETAPAEAHRFVVTVNGVTGRHRS
ncbi:hypothetical protein [Brevibacterium renqingii]|uniref:hypothetical protein n=1 Tax=Brevibacterium renqingii TaxID=2776916 RepID=UPI001ADF58FA|nr:hypothetical protein [Brevibacterium renqingii]